MRGERAAEAAVSHASAVSSAAGQASLARPSAATTEHVQQVPPGVYPLMREWFCGHGSKSAAARTILAAGHADETLVLVGLGHEAVEALEAVKQGFAVVAFEPRSHRLAALRARVAGRPEFEFVQPAQLQRTARAVPADALAFERRAAGAAAARGRARLVHARVGPGGGSDGELGEEASANAPAALSLHEVLSAVEQVGLRRASTRAGGGTRAPGSGSRLLPERG